MEAGRTDEERRQDQIGAFATRFPEVEAALGNVVHGQASAVRQVLVALFAGGHVLLEGAPGLGKTLLARTLAQVLGCRFRRIQFTPDLMPADVTGGNVFNQKEHRFDFVAGPVFTEVLLADEINRAPARTQAALLEAMGDRQVTIDGITRRLERPFFTIATQNPVESEGTWPLPDAQLDRFMLKVLVPTPPREAELAILTSHLAGFDSADLDRQGLVPLLDAAEIVATQDALRGVRVTRPVLEYITDLVGRTRAHGAVYLGASPRASVALLLGSQVLAAAEGRAFVLPDDIKELAPAVLRHRLVLHPEAEIDGASVDEVVADLIRETPVPASPGRTG
ncbi:MAG: MoxR family ATPase [Myxococcota bacterium]